MPIMPAKQLSHRRTDSNLAKKSMCSAPGPFAGRPLARPLSASPLPPTEETDETHVIRHAPSMPYLESGSRWMEKQEAKSLRQALEDMDLEEERKIHTAAQDEAAELVWKHRNPEAANAPKVFANPDLPKDYRSHLRKGSYQRRQSQDFSVQGQRSASDGSQTSNSDSSTTSSTKRVTFERPRKVSPPSANGVVSVHKRRESSSKSYDHLAEAVANDIAVAHRRTSSGSKRILSGEKKMYMHPNDKIWEDPSEEQSPPKKQPQDSNGEQQDTTTSTRPLPSHVRKNPFARVRAQYEKMERSNSAPTLQTLPPAPDLRHERVEIQRNPPSQSRNPWYMSNEALPPTPPSTSEHDADEVAPKMTPTKDGKEIRGDDIRAATSKTRKDYSPNLPRPTVVSDKPGRPIVSFEKNFQTPKEVVLEEQQAAEPEPEPSKMSRAATFPNVPSSANSRSGIPRIAVDDGPASRPMIPQINVPDEAPSSRPPIPQINLPGGPSSSRPSIPQINLPDEPSVPSIVLPDDPSNSTPSINVEAPSINVSGPDTRAPPARTQSSQPPLPSTRPLPHHAATAPLPTKSMPHYTPSIRQSGALCAHCALPIAGRILSAAGERFHPGCFVCHECNTNLECVAFYPEPDKQRSERLTRVRAREAGIELPMPEGMTDEEFGRQQAGDGDETLRFYCHLDFHELFSPRCKSCKTPIEGEVIVACGAEWHVGHFFCAQCGDPFDSSMPFVEKDGYAWCVGCHTNRYSSKCRKCKKPVTDVVVKALGTDWHSECFVCTECNGEFVDGRYFLRGESKDPVCVKCEEKRLKA
ncbi:hypothetical protein M409DRAFT_71218 [Zasmidium cellare ATCC 36951]|uniref:LIM zinc-binding domain-containing protein n=1 Tax=Zasmidium cellare ATCC 36951 TaxID=1080233 RepID=A0A6A6BZV0_ZASCE|nr:uncharacterized protein M409DRAFT_71218 [Zasmidium cellare ATCC 36951]KAF2159089.1 hypothetical protein M409DRAFT_71218 [Zasmidium cellare ATCC 36951]